MNSTLATLVFAFFIILGCIALLSISLLFSGRHRIRGGTCGRDPTKKEDECDKDDNGCGLCGKK